MGSVATMRAARFWGNKDLRVDTVPIPEPKGKQVLVEVEWCGICGSDLHEYLTGPVTSPLPEKPHPITGGCIPITMGHEICGRVKTAPEGSKLTPGQAVMIDPRLVCGSCGNCSIGRDHQCETLAFIGVTSRDSGGLSEFLCIDEHMLYILPDTVPLEYAAIIEPLAVAYHGIKVAEVPDLTQTDVLVVGGGPIGYAMILCLQMAGCRSIIVSEPTLVRRQRLDELKVTVIDPKIVNVGEKCRELTGGKGVHVAFDCAGVQIALDAACDALGSGGKYVNVSVWEESPRLPFWVWFAKEISFKCSLAYSHQDFREIMDFIGQGKFKGYENMVTSRIQLEDVVAKGFEELIHRKDDHVKILISPKPRTQVNP